MDAAPNASPARSLLIALPMYGAVEPVFLLSCLALTHALVAAGIEHQFLPLVGESHITRGRNRLVHHFVTKCTQTDLLFLDCDLGFDAETVLRLVRSGFDVVGAPYPLKTFPSRPVCSVSDAAMEEMRTRPNSPDTDGFVRAYDVPTGCLLIRRRVFDRLREIVPTYRDDTEPDPAKREIQSLFFDDGVEDGSRPDSRWLSEDYWFVRMAQLAGFETYVDARAKLRHVGKHAFECPSLEELWATKAAKAPVADAAQ